MNAPISAEMATHIYAVCAVILTVKMFALALATALVRNSHKLTLVPEDARGAVRLTEFDPPAVLRIKRAHLNDVENIPLFLILRRAGALDGGTGPDGRRLLRGVHPGPPRSYDGLPGQNSSPGEHAVLHPGKHRDAHLVRVDPRARICVKRPGSICFQG